MKVPVVISRAFQSISTMAVNAWDRITALFQQIKTAFPSGSERSLEGRAKPITADRVTALVQNAQGKVLSVKERKNTINELLRITDISELKPELLRQIVEDFGTIIVSDSTNANLQQTFIRILDKLAVIARKPNTQVSQTATRVLADIFNQTQGAIKEKTRKLLRELKIL